MVMAEDLDVFFQDEDFASSATYTPDGGSASTISGIFDDEYVEVDGQNVGIASNMPVFQCKTSDVISASDGDALVVNAVNYTIRVVKHDGTGMTILMLEKD